MINNKIKLSLVAAMMTATCGFADSSSVNEAFANGKVSGDISLFTKSVSKSGTNKDSQYSMSSIGLNYETDSFNGLTGSLGFRTNHKINEKEDGDFDESAPKSVLSLANVAYTNGDATVIAGRQEIDLEWIGDFHEAVVGVFNYIPNTSIVVAHTSRFMAVDDDGELGKMEDIGTDGASVIDVKYEGIKDTVINPYYMDAKDAFSAYGLKVETKVSNIDVTAHYAASSEDDATKQDGSIAHLEIATKVSNIGLSAGYITTDKDGGIGSLDTLGENIAPTKDIDGSVYGEDADTLYGKISADVASVSLSALYTATTHGASNDKDSELLIKAGTEVAESLEVNFLLSSASYENSNSDTDRVQVMATYSF